MTTELTDDQLRAMRDELRDRMAGIDAILEARLELRKLEANYLERGNAKPAKRVTYEVPEPPRSKVGLITEALSEPNPVWSTANGVQIYIKQQTGRLMKMSSLSPVLTDLKNKGVLVRRNFDIALAARVAATDKKPWDDLKSHKEKPSRTGDADGEGETSQRSSAD